MIRKDRHVFLFLVFILFLMFAAPLFAAPSDRRFPPIGPLPPVHDHPIADYRLDECSWDGTPGEVEDNSGSGDDGTVTGDHVNTTGTEKILCRGGYFSGDAIDIDNLNVSTARGDKTTVAFWMYWDGTNSVMPFGWWIYDLWLVNGDFGFNTGSGDLYGIKSKGLANGWHHVAAVFTNGNVHANELYIDGGRRKLRQLRNKPNNSRAVVNSSARIGGWRINHGYRFRGYLDELKIFDGPMSTGDILEIYKNENDGRNYDGSERECQCVVSIADYRLDECSWDGTPGEVEDNSGSGYHGTAKNGAATGADGKVCRTGRFDGNNSYADMGAVNFGFKDKITFMAWAKWNIDPREGNKWANIISNNSDKHGDRGQFWIQHNADNSHFEVAIDSQTSGRRFLRSTTSVSKGVWYHVAGVYDGTTFKIYVNGREESRVRYHGNITKFESSYKFNLGRWASANNAHRVFNGDIDEVKIYDKAISAAQVVDIYENEKKGKNYDGGERTCISCSSVDHFIVTDEDSDQQALACRGELITIQAVDNNDSLLSNYIGTITLTADNGALWYTDLSGQVNDDPPQGSWTDNGNASATYNFAAADNGQIKLWLRDSDIPAGQDSETVQVSVVDGTADGALAITYHKAGFRLVWDNHGNTVQLSGKPSDQGWNGQNIVLQGVQVNPITGACESLLDGSITVQAKISYLDPAAGSEPFNLNGNDVDESWTSVSLDFDQGEAPLVLQYHDAGRLQLEIRYDSDGDGVFDMFCINSEAIIFRPLGFFVYSTTSNWEANNGAGSSAFVKAGTNFNLSARAVVWQQSDDTDNDGIPDSNASLAGNGVTSHYEAADCQVTHSLTEPAGGSSGSLGTTSMDFAGGSGVIEPQTFSEVGIITLTVTDVDYLGSGAAITGTSSNIGRFIPDHFAVQSAAVSLAPACATFTYMGQNFGYQDAPQITITARNSNNEETQNYLDDFFKLPTSLTPAYSNNVSGRTLMVAPAPITLTAVSSQTVTVTDIFSYLREVAPLFDADFDLTLAVSDSDGVIYGSDGNFVINNIGGTELRSGRLIIYDNYGLETEDIIRSPFSTQYWDGSQWQLNSDDDCTTGIAFDSSRAHISSNPEVSAGLGYLRVDKPPGANPETITVCPVAPSWLSCSDTDCCGTFTFGIYRGNDRLILKMSQ